MGKHYPFHDRPDPSSWFNQKRRGIKLPCEQYQVLLSNQAFSGATAAEKLTITSALLDLKTPLLNLTAFQNSSQLRERTANERECEIVNEYERHPAIHGTSSA